MSEIERLRDYVDQLEDAFGISLKLPNEFGLTTLEMKLAGVLVRNDIANKEMLYAAAYASRNECDQPEMKTIDVHISNMRRKLAAKGFTIKTYYGMGYYLDHKTKALLRELCGVPVPPLNAMRAK